MNFWTYKSIMAMGCQNQPPMCSCFQIYVGLPSNCSDKFDLSCGRQSPPQPGLSFMPKKGHSQDPHFLQHATEAFSSFRFLT